MTGVTAENCLPVWQTLQIIGVIAENSLPAWENLQMTGVTDKKNDYLPDKLYK
jgi:hypothetical protein